MAPPRTCFVCQHAASNYTCAKCSVIYCSVACYKQHKETCSTDLATTAPNPPVQDPSLGSHASPSPDTDPNALRDPSALRPLTSLYWPYVPDTSAYPDPLRRDDPKPLQLAQYEALATSPAVREIFANPRVCALLASIYTLRGAERDQAIQRALGVDSRLLKNDGSGAEIDEDTRAFRALAEAVEVAVRGEREDALGLDWD